MFHLNHYTPKTTYFQLFNPTGLFTLFAKENATVFHSEENFNASVHSGDVTLCGVPYHRKMSARSACFVILSKDHRENERIA